MMGYNRISMGYDTVSWNVTLYKIDIMDIHKNSPGNGLDLMDRLKPNRFSYTKRYVKLAMYMLMGFSSAKLSAILLTNLTMNFVLDLGNPKGGHV